MRDTSPNSTSVSAGRNGEFTISLVTLRLVPWLGLWLLGMLFSNAVAHGQAAMEAWVRRYDSGEVSSLDYAKKIVIDSEGNAIVGGYTDDGTSGRDMLIIKYSTAGVALWTNRYDGPVHGDDEPYWLAVDGSGNIFVTGNTQISGLNYDSATVAYSGAGLPLWTNRYDGGAAGLAVDGSGNVFVTGSSRGGGGLNYDYATIAYSGAGVPLWTNRYDGPNNSSDQARALGVDNNGNVFVTGSSGSDYVTIAYSANGLPLWTNRYNGDYPTAMAVDNNGNVFVTGSSATIAYSGAGVPLWTNRHPVLPSAVAVDSSGNVFITGTWSAGSSDYATIKYSNTGNLLWSKRYNGVTNGADIANALAVDGSGNVFVTGHSLGSGGDFDFATIGYSGAGETLWTDRYSGSTNGHDYAYAVAVDKDGNVFVTGATGNDYATIKYSGAGVAVWTNCYNATGNNNDSATALVIDKNGNVIVTGSSIGSITHNDYATVAYSANGLPLWTNRHGGPLYSGGFPAAIAVDGSGNVFVTGSSPAFGADDDYATIAYSGAGVPLWTNRYHGPGNSVDGARDVAVDGNGNVFVTGYSFGSSGFLDYATIAYSGAGVPLWTNRWNGPGNRYDRALAMTIDASGNVFVTGVSAGIAGDDDYTTIAYSGAGLPLWTNFYNGPGYTNDRANDVAVDNIGNIFVTGYSTGSAGDYDYATIAYSGAGVPLWTNRYNGAGNTNDEAYAVAVDNNGNVFVTGYSAGIGGNRDYATIAYSGAGIPLWTNRFNGTGNTNDEAYAVAVDDAGNVFVTGYSVSSASDHDYATIAYSGGGLPLWTNRYNGPANGRDRAAFRGLAVGADGAVYVTGSSDAHYGADVRVDFATVKYVWRSHLAIQVSATSTVDLTLSGAPASFWSIERAIVLMGPWTNLGSVLIGTNGRAVFQDSNLPAAGGFYRATQP